MELNMKLETGNLKLDENNKQNQYPLSTTNHLF
jgi:hypothetical protein